MKSDYVTRYSNRYLTVLATSYCFGIIPYSHKRTVALPSQEVRYNIMLKHDPTPVDNANNNGQTEDQCCKHNTILNGLSYGMACLFGFPLFQDDLTRGVQAYYPLQVFIVDQLLMLVNLT